MPGTNPYGSDARYWTFQEETLSITTANVRQKIWPRGAGRVVEQLSIQAAVGNTDIVTIGSGRVAITTGIRQLLPGQLFTIALAEDVPVQAGEILNAPAKLVHPVEVFNADALFVISATAAQILLISLWFRQPGR
jgi:hypothetical protein